MALFINEGGDKDLKKNQVIVPDKLVKKLKLNKEILGKYKDTDGYKRISAIVDDDYNKRSDKKDRIHTDDTTISFGDLKRIDHDMRHMTPNPNNLEYVLQGGEEMKNWAHDALRKQRTSVKQVKEVPQVPKLQNDKVDVAKPDKDIKMGDASVRITENSTDSQFSNDGWHEYYDVLSEITAYDILWEYYGNNSNSLNWELIDPNMYQKALSEFTKFGKLIHFPEKYVYQWMGMMMRDTAKLHVCTALSGHENYFPSDEIYDFFYNHQEILDKYKDVYEVDYDYIDQYDFDEWSEFFYKTGFYDWMLLPDGSDAMSDFGLEPLERIISTYNENLPAEKVLVIINKMLDIVHCRGDLSSMFIVGGRNTLSQISEELESPKKVIFNESQLLLLKEYYAQTVFNFDKNGNPYYQKDNWQHYVDFLESLGKYGRLPKSTWTQQDVNKALDNAEDYAYSMNANMGGDESLEEEAIYAYIYELLQDRYRIDFNDYFHIPEIVDGFNNFDEWYRNEHGMEEDEPINDVYIDERDVNRFLESVGIDSYDRLSGCLYNDNELEEKLRNAFLDRQYQYGFPDDLTYNERGLIYVEREITIPQFDTPKFDNIDKRGNYYKYLKNEYSGVGDCWSWEKGFAEAYSSQGYGVGTTHLTLKGWVDPKDVDWTETLYRNCYSLNEERELYLGYNTPVEVERAEIDGDNIITQPIIVTT